MLAAGALLAWWLGGLILRASSVIVLIVVSLFIAFGLSPVVEWLIRRNVRRRYAVLLVALGFLAALALFVLAIAPVVADQVAALTKNAPDYFDKLLHNRQIERWDRAVRHRQQGPGLRHQRQDHPGPVRRRARA